MVTLLLLILSLSLVDAINNKSNELSGHLKEGQYIQSLNGQYSATMQIDGNFVLYTSDLWIADNALWNTGTGGKGTHPYRCTMQTDNNLVVYDAWNNALWNSGTTKVGVPGATLTMQDNGNLVIHDGDGRNIWSTHTGYVTLPPTRKPTSTTTHPTISPARNESQILEISSVISSVSHVTPESRELTRHLLIGIIFAFYFALAFIIYLSSNRHSEQLITWIFALVFAMFAMINVILYYTIPNFIHWCLFNGCVIILLIAIMWKREDYTVSLRFWLVHQIVVWLLFVAYIISKCLNHDHSAHDHQQMSVFFVSSLSIILSLTDTKAIVEEMEYFMDHNAQGQLTFARLMLLLFWIFFALDAMYQFNKSMDAPNIPFLIIAGLCLSFVIANSVRNSIGSVIGGWIFMTLYVFIAIGLFVFALKDDNEEIHLLEPCLFMLLELINKIYHFKDGLSARKDQVPVQEMQPLSSEQEVAEELSNFVTVASI